ncbi:MAG: helix-turn-helix domain-containing protein [Pseudomonadota bacterium]
MKKAGTRYFGFLVNDVARMYSEQFDRLVRPQTGLTLAQCRLLGALASRHGEEEPKPLSQVGLSQRMYTSAMNVVGLCNRMARAGWIRRTQHPADSRANLVSLEPQAEAALEAALAAGDALTGQVLAILTAEERALLLELLAKVRAHQQVRVSLDEAPAAAPSSS